jgi:ribosome biogenesis GTPase A
MKHGQVAFRKAFPFLNNPKVNWFPGHMARIYKELPEHIKKIDLLLEVRDCRIPITSGNPELLKFLNPGVKRMILFNKYDLCNKKKTEDIIKNNFKNDETLILSAKTHNNVKKILERIGKEKKEFKIIGVWAMVCGIPNVGKSSIINSLRSIGNQELKKDKLTHNAKKGDLPTTTRHVNFFKVNKEPTIYIMDSPGIIPPKLNRYNLDTFKLSACRNITSNVVEKQWVCDYILFHLNNNSEFNYVKEFKLNNPTDDIIELTKQIREKYLKNSDNDVYDVFIKKFNEGDLGRVTFDEENIKELVPAIIENTRR